MIVASWICMIVGCLCTVGAFAILVKPGWWEQYKVFGWLLLGIAIVLMVLAGWGMFLPNHEVI